MASRFARFQWPRIRTLSYRPRALFGVSGALGLYYATNLRKIHADDAESRKRSAEFHDSKIKPLPGVQREDVLLCSANLSGGEDWLGRLYVNSGSWTFWSIYDGHNGDQTAKYVANTLAQSLNDSLWKAFQEKGRDLEIAEIHAVFKDRFLALDDQIVNQSTQKLLDQPEGAPLKALAAAELQEAYSGCCALVAFYEAQLRRLHIAVVGDSRAILGRPRKSEFDGPNLYDVHVLSVDQTPENPAEVERLTAAHPHEPHLFEGGRFLGWGITRAFGSGTMKWSRDLQDWMERKCYGDKPRPKVQSPPYFTAEPEITTTTIEPGDFLIMGSDGLWDCITNEEAVGLVGLWLEREGGSDWDPDNVIDPRDLPVELKNQQTHYKRWGVKKRFINVDMNAARHLGRNALGGADKELNDVLLSTPPPRARQFRDDMSVVVIVFE